MYRYSAFGLGIASELPLPELRPGCEAVDVTIRFRKLDFAAKAQDDNPSTVWVDGAATWLHWQEIGTFWVYDGREIGMDLEPELPPDRLRLYLLGAVMGVLLCQRGLAVFHAGAVALHGKVIAFMGAKGWGKSTMIAALHAAGHALVADDLLGVETGRGQPLALPAFPQLKLWPDALMSLDGSNNGAWQDGEFEKQYVRVQANFAQATLPLAALYVLGHAEQPLIERIEGSKAMLELMRHWYCARFGTEVLQGLGYAAHFLNCALIAHSVPVFRLGRPRSLESLPQIVQLVEAHAREEVLPCR